MSLVLLLVTTGFNNYSIDKITRISIHTWHMQTLERRRGIESCAGLIMLALCPIACVRGRVCERVFGSVCVV